MIAALDLMLFLGGNGDTPMAIAKYRQSEASAELWFYKNSLNLFGISPRKIIKYLGDTLNGRRFTFVSRRRLSEEKLTELVKKATTENIPVIIRIGENFKTLPYTIAFTNGVFKRKMRWHYITAVNADSGKIEFYSWGGKGKMKITDLWRYFGFTGGIILPSDMYK